MSDHKQWSVKYRPRTLEEFVGQPAAVAYVKGLIKTNNIPGCILITGQSGTGKTTLGRIIAGKFSGGSSDPSKNRDINEVSANADRTVDEVRELIKRARLNPVGGKRRCIVVDEVHVYPDLSAKTLLKEIEEPAPKTTWILCTDQPERLPRQLANRSQPVALNPVADNEMIKLLQWVLDCEKRNFGKAEDAILKRITEASYGVPRQAIQLLDMVNTALLGGGKPSEALNMAIRSASATEAFDSAIKYIRAMFANDMKAAVASLNEASSCDGMLHLLTRMLNGLAYTANGGRPKDGLGWAVTKAMGRQDLDRILHLQMRVCTAADILTRSNYQVPAESLLLAMVRKG